MCHKDEAILSRRQARIAGGVQGNGEWRGDSSRRETAVDEGRNEIADRVARYQAN